MDALEAIGKRISVREYSQKPIAPDVLDKIINAGRLAPTARAIEPWEFVVIADNAMKKKIADIASTGRFIGQSAACVAVFCKDTKYYLEDGCAATENILIAAAALGVGSCWVAGDKKPYCQQIGQMLGVPPELKLVSLISLGYPKGEVKPHKKRDLKEVLHRESF